MFMLREQCTIIESIKLRILRTESDDGLGSLEGDGAFWFVVTLMLWLPFFLSLLHMPHFVFWDFWCAPGELGLSLSGFFFLIVFLGIAWTMARALADAGPPAISRLLLEVVVIGFLSVLIHVMTIWFGSAPCRIAASPEEARSFARTLGEEWVPPEGYRAIACVPATQQHCWRRKDLPPYAEAEPFEMIPPASSLADRPAVCEAGLRLAYRPQRVETPSEGEVPLKSGLLSHCETERRISLPPDAILLYGKIHSPQPEGSPVIFNYSPFPTFFICRFSEDGRLRSAMRFNNCDQLAPLRARPSGALYGG